MQTISLILKRGRESYFKSDAPSPLFVLKFFSGLDQWNLLLYD